MKTGLAIAVIGLAASLAIATSKSPGRYYGLDERVDPSFDCSAGFSSLVARIRAIPGILAWGDEKSPTSLFQDDGQSELFIVTNSSHPSHPAIIRRSVALSTEGVGFVTEACAFGDRKALEDDLRGYEALDDALAAEFECFLCNRGLVSPSLSRNVLHHYSPSSR